MYVPIVIKLNGVTVRRVCIPQLADRLVHAGHPQTAAKLLFASSKQQDVDLTGTECAEIITVLQTDCPADLRELRVALDDATHQATDNRGHQVLGPIQPKPA